MRYCRLIAIAIFVFGLGIAFSASSSHAFSFDVILDPTLLSQKDALFGVSVADLAVHREAMYGIGLVSREVTQDQAFVLNRDTGQVTFGDGLTGSIPPSGSGGTAAAYRYGSGSTVVLTPFSISLDELPVLIPLDDPLTDVVETEISFFLLGINSLRFEVVGNGVWITAITPVPEPATMLLLASGLVGLVGLRKRFRKQ